MSNIFKCCFYCLTQISFPELTLSDRCETTMMVIDFLLEPNISLFGYMTSIEYFFFSLQWHFDQAQCEA